MGDTALTRSVGSDRRYRSDWVALVLGAGLSLLPLLAVAATRPLIDAHIHYFQSGGLYTRPDVIDLGDWRTYETKIGRSAAFQDFGLMNDPS